MLFCFDILLAAFGSTYPQCERSHCKAIQFQSKGFWFSILNPQAILTVTYSSHHEMLLCSWKWCLSRWLHPYHRAWEQTEWIDEYENHMLLPSQSPNLTYRPSNLQQNSTIIIKLRTINSATAPETLVESMPRCTEAVLMRHVGNTLLKTQCWFFFFFNLSQVYS